MNKQTLQRTLERLVRAGVSVMNVDNNEMKQLVATNGAGSYDIAPADGTLMVKQFMSPNPHITSKLNYAGNNQYLIHVSDAQGELNVRIYQVPKLIGATPLELDKPLPTLYEVLKKGVN